MRIGFQLGNQAVQTQQWKGLAQGQNALVQARHFQAAAEVTGAILAKLDGTAKGGMAFAICAELGIPIKFIGTGETVDDWAIFDAEAFVAGLFEQDGD